MFPIGDSSRRLNGFPTVTVLIIAINALVFGLELMLGDAFVERWSLVPAAITHGQGWITILTSMFMHAGWMHIIGNMVFLWAFGPQIEDLLGSARFGAFYLLAGLAATIAQVAISPNSRIPNLGASGAIAGVMGAFLITYPQDRIRTLILNGYWTRIAYVPAIFLVGIWILTQVLSEVGSITTVGADVGGVAYMAHIGGFFFGLVCVRLFETTERRLQHGLN